MNVVEASPLTVGARSFQVPSASAKGTKIPPWYLIRNGVREVLYSLGERLTRLPHELHSSKRIPCFSEGGPGNEVGINALVPTRQTGTAKSFYVEKLSENGSAKVFGPFKVNSLGVVVTPSAPESLFSSSGIDTDALAYVFQRIMYMDEEGGFIPATQLPRGDAGEDSVRARVLRPVVNEFADFTVTAKASGKAAIDTFMQEAYSRSDYRPMMRSTLDALVSSGYLKNAYYYSVASKDSQYSRTGDVLVLVDKRNRAFGFRLGTIF